MVPTKNSSSPKNTARGLVMSQADVYDALMYIIKRTRSTPTDCIVRRQQLRTKSGRARATSYLDVANGTFPPPFSIGGRAVGFSSNEIDAWIAATAFSSQLKTPIDMKAFIHLLVQSRLQLTDLKFKDIT